MDIDFITTYVDMMDPNWQALYKRAFKCRNISQIERYIDCGFIKYQLRGIEKFMPWIRKVIFIVQSKSQIPKWLNTKNPKLRIVYHNEYIPKEFLPTFNSNVIEMYISKINGLAGNFILANDDMIPVNPVGPEFFFKNSLPIYKKKITDNNWVLRLNGIFDHTLYNNAKLVQKLCKTKTRIKLQNSHLMIPYNLSFWKKCFKMMEKDIHHALSRSRKRNIYNLNHWVFRDMAIMMNEFVDNQELNTKGYIGKTIVEEKDFLEKLNGAKTSCFNGEFNKMDPTALNNALKILNQIFPEKSSFEL